MKQRCYNHKHKLFKTNGNLLIKVCDRWLHPKTGLPNFIADMGKRPEGTTLGRIDIKGNYTPENCKWVLKSEEKRYFGGKLYKFGGITENLHFWSDHLGIPYATLYQRINKSGWSIKKAFMTPVRKR